MDGDQRGRDVVVLPQGQLTNMSEKLSLDSQQVQKLVVVSIN